jgi:hypothetical protein
MFINLQTIDSMPLDIKPSTFVEVKLKETEIFVSGSECACRKCSAYLSAII